MNTSFYKKLHVFNNTDSSKIGTVFWVESACTYMFKNNKNLYVRKKRFPGINLGL